MILLDRPKIQPSIPNLKLNSSKDAYLSLAIALGIIAIWASSTALLMTLDMDKLPPLVIVFLMLWQMFLYTGLFVTAHDAMHGVVFAKNRKINDLVGSIAVGIYALFSLKQLAKKHKEHHDHPASEIDPDFHNGKQKNFFAWYCQFSTRYWSWTRIVGLMAIFHLLKHTVNFPEANLAWFWIVPSILSSVQLFYFGSYLVHREPKGGYTNPHRSVTTNLSTFWSFITCYHFGYHYEHHEHPYLPWWRLPEAYKLNKLDS